MQPVCADFPFPGLGAVAGAAAPGRLLAGFEGAAFVPAAAGGVAAQPANFPAGRDVGAVLCGGGSGAVV